MLAAMPDIQSQKLNKAKDFGESIGEHVTTEKDRSALGKLVRLIYHFVHNF